MGQLSLCKWLLLPFLRQLRGALMVVPCSYFRRGDTETQGG